MQREQSTKRPVSVGGWQQAFERQREDNMRRYEKMMATRAEIVAASRRTGRLLMHGESDAERAERLHVHQEAHAANVERMRLLEMGDSDCEVAL